MAQHQPTLLINRQSGTARDLGLDVVRDRVIAAFEAGGCGVSVELLDGPAIEGRLRELVGEGAESVIVGGGDGTVTTAASVLRGTGTALGVLPLGTFNLLARDLEIPSEIEEAAEVLCRGRRREIDVAEVNGRLVLCVCIAGFYPNLMARSHQTHTRAWWVKAAMVTWETLRAFMRYRSLRLELEEDDGGGGAPKVEHFRTRFLAVSNNRFEDLFGVVPRRAALDHGRLAAYISEHHSQLGLLRWMILYLIGKWEDDQDIRIREVTRLVVRTRKPKRLRLMIDGELVKEATPLKFECFPKDLTVLC
ncbi:diacylglycerol kinase family protein [soil metagenome]